MRRAGMRSDEGSWRARRDSNGQMIEPAIRQSSWGATVPANASGKCDAPGVRASWIWRSPPPSPDVVTDVADACDRLAILGAGEIDFQSSDSPKSEFVRRSGSAEN
jgi:hypothetical protein